MYWPLPMGASTRPLVTTRPEEDSAAGAELADFAARLRVEVGPEGVEEEPEVVEEGREGVEAGREVPGRVTSPDFVAGRTTLSEVMGGVTLPTIRGLVT